MSKPPIGLAAFAAIALLSGCELPEDGTATTVVDAATPSTTVAATPATVLVQSYEAETLDGRMITIRAGEGALSSFTEGVPSEMHSIQLLAQQGDCEQIRSTGDLWASLADETDEGLKASAFAKQAYNVHAFIQCADAQPPTEPPAPVLDTPTDPRFSTCTEAKENGYGDYVRGVDPEYEWYDDRDNDDIVCE